MTLTFRRLQVFVIAATEGNFRRTADVLGISQPSVSAQVRAMEQHLGHALFERRRGAKCVLTPEGREFLGRARELLQAHETLASERQTVRRAQAAVLRVSVGPILLESRLKPMLADFHERHPEIALEFVPFNPVADGEKAVRSGALDVLLYTGGPPTRRSVRTEIVATVGCSLYASTGLARRLHASTVDAISNLPFVIPPKDYRITQWIEAQLAALDVRPRNVVAQPPYMDVVLRMVLEGHGVALLFDDHASEAVKRGELRAIGGISFPAHRVMLMGRRALRAEVAPALHFLRTVASAGRRPLQAGSQATGRAAVGLMQA